jgi:CRP-like cAMP-binding protein
MRKALYVMGILDDTDIEWMRANGRRMSVGRGDVLIREGEPVDALFIVLDGRLEVMKRGKFITTLLSGEIVGEISFVDTLPPAATVLAEQTATVLAIPRELLHARMSTDPHFASRFYRALSTFLADRLRVTTAKLSGENGDAEGDELALEMMGTVSLAAARFDGLLKRLSAAGR